MIQYLLSTVMVFSCLLHPIHVSVTDIVYNQERKALEVTSHIFLDDLERHVREINDEPYLDITKPGKGRTSDKMIETYLRDHFKLKVNGKKVAYNYLGHEAEVGAVYIYTEVENIEKLASIAIRNEVLLDLFDDQVNMVHVKVDGKLRSLKLEDDNREDMLKYD